MQQENVQNELDREFQLDDVKRRALHLKRARDEAALAHAESILDDDDMEGVSRIMGKLDECGVFDEQGVVGTGG